MLKNGDFMVTNIIKSIIFGIVEGITEFLPISSTGHLILLDNILKLSNDRAFTNLFEIFIQSGAILSVIFVYFNKLWPLEYKKNEKKIKFSSNKIKLWIYIIIAIIPFGIVGLFADDFIQERFFNPTCVSITLIFYGIVFIIIEIFLSRKEKIEKTAKNAPVYINGDTANYLDFKKAFIIGCFQLLAVIPGTSRSAATIIGGLILGLPRVVAAEFSFFLAIPTLIGAGLVSLIKAKVFYNSEAIILLAIGFIVSFIVALLVIRFFIKYLAKHDFKIFGYYRIILGIIVLILLVL